jgi:phospholipid/cholesterol/gamma-HCH transport system substrate-binding protein
MSLREQIRRYLRPFLAILALVLVATGVAAYILEHQRLRFPWEDYYTVSAEFTSAQSVTPGQGQDVQVAGVSVGEITRVELRNGRAVVETQIEPRKLKAVYRDARMLLRPKTGLKDMSIQLDPGSPAAGRLGEDDVLPAARTVPDVNADEVLAALDADTRAYLAAVVDQGGRGLDGRGEDLRAVLRASRPAVAQTRRVTRAVADRRVKLRRLVRNLRVLSEATASREGDLARLVEASNATFGALASQEGALRQSVSLLPGTLSEAERAFTASGTLFERLGPALTALRPAARNLAPALRDLRPLLRDAVPILRDQIRPLVRGAQPLAADLPPTLRDLLGVTPDLVRAFRVLTYVVNELAYNPAGPEEGYLFWTAWFSHNANSILSVEDAHGVVWRGQLITSCSTFQGSGPATPILSLITVKPPVCPA